MATPLTPVTSSNIDSVGRIKTKRKDDLRVLFKSGGVYDYKGAGDVLNSILATDSKGRFLHFWVKGLYSYIQRA